MSDMPEKTPIDELLANVPEDARCMYEHSPTHHQNIPFGALAKEALDELSTLSAENERLREALQLCIDELRESIQHEGKLASFSSAINRGEQALQESENAGDK